MSPEIEHKGDGNINFTEHTQCVIFINIIIITTINSNNNGNNKSSTC